MPKKNEMSQKDIEALKEELKKELLIEMKKEEAEKYKAEQERLKMEEEAKKKASEKTEFKIKTDSKIDKFDRLVAEKKPTESSVETVSTSSNFFLIIILFLVIAGIYFLPVIRDAFNKPKVENGTPVTTQKTEEKEPVVYKWSDKIVKDITLPIMRNDVNSPESYYKNAKMTVSSFTNNDILYNALINVYKGNMAYYDGGYNGAFCGAEDQRRMLNEKYITARINNMFTKNTEYTFTDFYVPVSSGSKFIGSWRYDAINHRFIYYGECNPYGIIEPIYKDILVEDKIETSEDGKTAYLTYGVAFAVINVDGYSIYRDYNYTDLLIRDTFKTDNQDKELQDIMNEFSKDHKLNKYKYTYSTIDCSYSELCYISGEWVNE